MRLSRDFLTNMRIMTHTLVEHMGNMCPNPWEDDAVALNASDENATIAEATTLADEMEYLLVHSLKLSRQLVRAHALLATGTVIAVFIQPIVLAIV